MNAVLAGWAMGYFMAIVSTVALAFLLFRIGVSGVLDRFVAPEVNRGLLVVPVFIGATLGWTMIGLIFGSLYEVTDLASKPDAFGSKSWPWTLIIVVLALLPLPPLVLVVRRYWWLWFGLSAAFVGAFGWVMPLLAAR
jgi:hypothetical protein